MFMDYFRIAGLGAIRFLSVTWYPGCSYHLCALILLILGSKIRRPWEPAS